MRPAGRQQGAGSHLLAGKTRPHPREGPDPKAKYANENHSQVLFPMKHGPRGRRRGFCCAAR